MLHVHRAERADGLVAALRDLLSDPLGDPFAPEVIAVPTRGMERWLTQRMSLRLGATPGRADGICANVEFPFPRRLAGDAVAAASGIDPDADPWLPERAVWPLLEVVDASLDEPWLEVLAKHFGAAEDEARRTRRFSTVRHLADLFDRYALHRPDLVRAWAAGSDEGERWQAELWRRLRERLDVPSLAERIEAACDAIRADPALVDLPPRLSLFGLTRIPAGHLDVLEAIAGARDVHLFLLHPSPALWERLRGEPSVTRRADDETATLAQHRLIASWGQDAREMQLVLAGASRETVEHHHDVEAAEDSLLGRIQADVRADRAPAGLPLDDEPDGRPLLDTTDRSVQVHACHGRARQVEVLRDAILHELQEDPTLEPRDVIVMCPDIEEFAPLVHATFGAGEVGDDDELDTLPDDVRPPDLRVRLADRSLRQTNPVLGVVAALIDLAAQRLTASEVLDLADREPVRRRFRLDDDDLGRIEDWVADSGIRWGLDAAHRAPFKLDGIPAGTWHAGLDRVLVGVTMTEEGQRLFEGVLPVDDVESGAIDLAGRFAELVDRLQDGLDALRAPKPIDAWAAAIGAAADALTATSQRDAWQRAELQRILDDVVSEATSGDQLATAHLGLPEVRALLDDRLQGRPTRANFRTGHMTVCTLVPMRSVPHRVVCLLGLDDNCFPRKAPRDGDDLMLNEPRVGERDPRSEDRQMLLDALMAATDRLIVTYTGNDERTNAVRPPAVPVGELLDVVDRTVRLDDANRPARTAVVTRHPLQPFDARNFTRGRLVRDRVWSFDRVTLAGARALDADRTEPSEFLPELLPPWTGDVIELDDLVRFAQEPVRTFLRTRLGVEPRDFTDEVADALPVELDHLEKWGIGDRLLKSRLKGSDARTACLAEIARGTLPPGHLGKVVVDELFPIVEGLVEAAQQILGTGEMGAVDVQVALPEDGAILNGTVGGVVGDVLSSLVYSRVGPKHRLAAWVRLLAVTAAHPERAWTATTIGRANRRSATVGIFTIPPIGPDADARRTEALRLLDRLADLYRRGMRGPVPVACKTSAAYAAAVRDGRDGPAAAVREWRSDFAFPKEDDAAEHVLVFGGHRTFDELRAEGPADGESGLGWDPSEPSRFGRWARRLWDPLLDLERPDER
ncbi:MAG: Exodeoxyribonuclease V gamma chain [uncultured Solirubrobacteraceae bacterium]|uniref:RecBCD enzyme subunit RecC n=1 Tax=uncultured Solirubrobacteraceae bacterium TaxID=1162706 RepID=A0A6J4RR69_9ACTN|nr:MAG: Exodeoxyribonuclease V gamma chain [uncultured Solirubrobacteraceae bacterium]